MNNLSTTLRTPALRIVWLSTNEPRFPLRAVWVANETADASTNLSAAFEDGGVPECM
jgi:hypothetical protein